MEPADVVSEALRSLGQTDLCVAGSNKLAAFLLTRLLPRRRASALMTPFCSATISTLRNLPDKCQRSGATLCWWQRAWWRKKSTPGM